MLGREGIVGACAALEARALNNAIVQIGGAATWIDFGTFRRIARTSPAIRDLLQRHDRYLLALAQQTAACIASHVIEERLCSRLLRTGDLAETSLLPQTQESLARMLGVRRTSIALAVKRLHNAGLIDHRRGHIRIVDLDGLRNAACECYEAIRNQAATILMSRVQG